MKEEFLHFIWQYQKFNTAALTTTEGDLIQIISQGEINTNSGPDFFNAKIRIGDTIWVGNVEIHINSSAWIAHKHQNDSAYNNVILHVVYQNDKIILDQRGNEIPCFELAGKIQYHLLQNYQNMMASKGKLACENSISTIDAFTKNGCKENLAIERLERKVDEIQQLLVTSKGDWEEVSYKMLLRVFGQEVNKEPFITLSQYLPYHILRKQDSFLQIEALIFGVSGFLSEKNDTHAISLQNEFLYLQKKYGFKTMDKEQWKFMRMRPGNFPTVRLAQLVSLIDQNRRFLRLLIEESDLKTSKTNFLIRVEGYWKEHYSFGKRWSKTNVQMGQSFLNHMYINAFIPLLFAYSKDCDDSQLQEKSINWLQEIPGEKNRIVSMFQAHGFEANNAMDSQGIIQLFRNYCEPKKCLNCAIGYKILNKG
jgi:hypothetical protein